MVYLNQMKIGPAVNENILSSGVLHRKRGYKYTNPHSEIIFIYRYNNKFNNRINFTI